jgi:hypothetical protein
VKNCEIKGQRYTIISKDYFPGALKAVKKCASDSKISVSTAAIATPKPLAWSKVAADLNPENKPLLDDVDPKAIVPSIRGEPSVTAQENEVQKIENKIENKITNIDIGNKIGIEADSLNAMKTRIDELLQENHRKDGELRVYKEFMDILQRKAQDARDEQLKAEKKLEIMTQSLLCRSLLGELPYDAQPLPSR